MTNAGTAISTEANTVALVGQTISRSQIETLIAQTTQPLVFEACDFEGVDLSRLNLRGIEFQDCAFMRHPCRKPPGADAGGVKPTLKLPNLLMRSF